MTSKKEISISFLQLASSGKVKEAYDKYAHSKFIHHNAYFKGDKESLMKGMEKAHQTNPNEFLKIKKVFENKDSIAIHSHVKQKNNNNLSVVHIFRFEKNKIIELWDIGIVIPEDSPNKYGAF